MKNGDPRSPAWVKRKLRDFTRDNEATYACLLLVSGELVGTTPQPEEISHWTDEQCLLAEDWALAVHYRASDNNNRVPAVPEHLRP